MSTIFQLVLGIYSPLKQDAVEREEPKGSLESTVAEDGVFGDDQNSEGTPTRMASAWTGEDMSSFINWSDGNLGNRDSEWCGPETSYGL